MAYPYRFLVDQDDVQKTAKITIRDSGQVFTVCKGQKLEQAISILHEVYEIGYSNGKFAKSKEISSVLGI